MGTFEAEITELQHRGGGALALAIVLVGIGVLSGSGLLLVICAALTVIAFVVSAYTLAIAAIAHGIRLSNRE